MPSYVVLRHRGPRLAGAGRQAAGRAEETPAIMRPIRRRRPRRGTDPRAGLLPADRAPEESYRDYMFRKAIWP